MQSGGMNIVVKSILFIALSFAITLGFDYVSQVIIGKGAFSPSWGLNIVLSIIVGISGARGLEAAKRKQNEENSKK